MYEVQSYSRRMSKTPDLQKLMKTLTPFAEKWVALVGDKVVASGESVKEVKQKADAKGVAEYSFYLVPSRSTLFAPVTAWGSSFPTHQS